MTDFDVFLVRVLEVFLAVVAALGGVGLGIALMTVFFAAALRFAEWLADR